MLQSDSNNPDTTFPRDYRWKLELPDNWESEGEYDGVYATLTRPSDDEPDTVLVGLTTDNGGFWHDTEYVPLSPELEEVVWALYERMGY